MQSRTLFIQLLISSKGECDLTTDSLGGMITSREKMQKGQSRIWSPEILRFQREEAVVWQFLIEYKNKDDKFRLLFLFFIDHERTRNPPQYPHTDGTKTVRKKIHSPQLRSPKEASSYNVWMSRLSCFLLFTETAREPRELTVAVLCRERIA